MNSLKTIFAAFLLLSPCLLFAQDDVVKWSPKKLTWNDYLAKPAETEDAAAITSTALGIEYHVKENVLTYKISCLFSKTKSWGRFKSDYILSHEQGHFDIAELFARKLNQETSEYKFNRNTFKTDLDAIYKSVVDEKEKYQQLYDDETNYSRNKKKQEEWLKKIEDELKETKDWADY